MCSCVSPGWSGPTAVSPTRVGSPASPGRAAPSKNQPTRKSHSHVRAPGAGERVSVATGVFVPVTLFGGRRHLEVIVEDALGPGDSASLGLLVDGRALSRRGWPLRRPWRRGRRVPGAPCTGGAVYRQLQQPSPSLRKSILRGWAGTRMMGGGWAAEKACTLLEGDLSAGGWRSKRCPWAGVSLDTRVATLRPRPAVLGGGG